MTRLSWDNVGERFFEAGVDRGVLYLDGQEGVPWNGLISVSESPTNEEVKSFYIDGIKYLSYAVGEEFEATIQAFTYPDEFSVCEGTKSVLNGLSVSQQRKQSFGLCYRTKIGNDVDGIEHGYKLHLVYNALTSSSTRDNNSVGETIDPLNFSWQITTKPPELTGFKNSAHLIIDSRDTPPLLLSQIEDLLYGTELDPPRLLPPDEIMFMFEVFGTVVDGGAPDDHDILVLDGGSP